MPSATTIERDRYAEVWGLVDAYHDNCAGEQVLPAFLDLTGPSARGRHVLDAGCGNGKAALALAAARFRVSLCDLTDVGLLPEARAALPFTSACLWQPLTPQGLLRWYDYIYCTDVLEHLPTQYVGLALRNLLDVTSTAAFFSVSTIEDVHGHWVGAPLHQTVQSFVWWRDLFRELGTVEDARDLWTTATFYVRPR